MPSLNWHMPADLLERSIEIMRPHGARGNEGLALWFGMEGSDFVRITHVVEVHGPGFRTSPLHLSLSLAAMSSLTDLAERLNAFLIGQIHSHPETLVGLSDVDRELGVRSPDYLSVVCPYYAQRTISGFDICGVHVFEPPSFRRLQTTEVSRRLILLPYAVNKLSCEVRA